MQKTKIEWTDYTLNPIKGLCQHACWYCYARNIYKRFKLDEHVYLRPHELTQIFKLKKPSKIFLCSTHDMFGDWIPDEWINFILKEIEKFPQHTFQILTKNPKRVHKMSLKLPDNIWFGITITNDDILNHKRLSCLINSQKHIKAKIKFISFEPLLEEIKLIQTCHLVEINWIIIGALTGPKRNQYLPKAQWIRKIIDHTDKYNIPIFMKNNLKRYWDGEFRQEFPI